jgi:antibiotic biosynthesis monooxygenase (ABM) superfamily enzyme
MPARDLTLPAMSPTANPKSTLPARLVITLAAWVIAFLSVTALLELFGDELASLPLAPRALVISGVLVSLMANVVMPVLHSAIARTRLGRGGPRCAS